MDVGILFTAFLLLLSHLVPFLSAQEYNQSSSVCPQSFQGSYLDILSFPYTIPSQPDCGLCMVDCDSHPYPKIQLVQSSKQWFYAKGKLQEDFIWVNDPILESHLNHKSCESFFHDIRLPNSPSITFRTSATVTLFRCNKTQLSPSVTDHFRGYRSYETCEDLKVYYKHPKQAGSPGNPPIGCLSIQVPLRSWDRENSEVFELLTATFGLGWNVSDACYYGCHLKGGQCRTDKMNTFLCANP